MIASLILIFLPMVICLEILELRVPDLVDVQGTASMSCKFNLHGDRLYSVKWYKDEFEFFRYMPSSEPNILFFPVEGVHPLKDACNETTVVLEQLEYNTSGTYRCEVSTEAPHFNTDLSQSNMTVLGLPKEDPWIQGVLATYSVGDYVTANCTSSPSYPPATLTWFINHEKAEHWVVTEYPTPKTRHYLAMESRSLGLRFQVDNSHFPQSPGILTLTCSANVSGLTRRRVTKSYLAKLTNEKFAQERSLRSKGSGISRWRELAWLTAFLVQWTTILV